MKLHSLPLALRTRRALLALLAVAAAGVGAQQAFASTNCAEICIAEFGLDFTNDRGDYFVLKDCATSELGTGRTYCTYARLPAMT